MELVVKNKDDHCGWLRPIQVGIGDVAQQSSKIGAGEVEGQRMAKILRRNANGDCLVLDGNKFVMIKAEFVREESLEISTRPRRPSQPTQPSRNRRPSEGEKLLAAVRKVYRVVMTGESMDLKGLHAELGQLLM